MDSFEINKILGAVLGTLLFVMGVGFLAEAIYHPIEGRGPGYPLPEPEVAVAAEAGGAAAEAATPLPVLLASASAEEGQAAARKCQACHNFAEGAGNKQGPELYGVVGRLIGSHAGFAYSDGMKEHETKGDMWSYENLDAFLDVARRPSPPGTKMNFAGVKDPVERANLLAYLQTLSHNPVPFPTAEASGEPATPTEANPVATPTETQNETPVQGTATGSGPAGGETPATETPAAPATEAPAAPANEAPAAPAAQ